MAPTRTTRVKSSSMEQRQNLNGGRRRRRRSKNETKPKSAPVLIAARRPDSPRLMKISRRNIAASAQPKRARGEGGEPELPSETRQMEVPAQLGKAEEAQPRRVVRIAQTRQSALDESESRRERLLERLVHSEGRIAISRLVDELLGSGGIPERQEYQLQLLEHVDEQKANAAMDVLARLFETEPPIKRPILDQRLRRLEDEADEAAVRTRAAELRRSIRSQTPARAS